MKLGILLPLLSVVVASLTVWALVGCKAASNRRPASEQFPAICTLLAMSPDDRAVHQRRLDTLRQAAQLERKTADGFEFTVDLRRMSAHDMGLWMQNEQKCCSFLRMSSKIDEAQTHARISVKCPPELRSQVIESFGLQAR